MNQGSSSVTASAMATLLEQPVEFTGEGIVLYLVPITGAADSRPYITDIFGNLRLHRRHVLPD